MNLTLTINEPLLLGFYKKVGEDRTKNLIMNFLRIYAQSCSTEDKVVESAIIESQKAICQRILTKQDVMGVVSTHLNNIPGSTDLENLKLSIIKEIRTLLPSMISNDKDLSLRDLDTMRDSILRELALTTLKTDDTQVVQRVEQLISGLSDIKEKVEMMSEYFGKNVTKKGVMAENVYETLLNEKFKTAEINRTSDSNKSGDFIIVMNNKRYMLDIKNYTTNIHKSEIDKLSRDVHECKVDGGILISVNSGIKDVDRIGVIVSDNVPIVLLPNNGIDVDMVEFAIKFIDAYIPPKDVIDKQSFIEMVTKVKGVLKGFDEAIKQIQNSKQKVIEALSFEKPKNALKDQHYCNLCHKFYKSQTALKSHNRYKHEVPIPKT